MKKIFALLLALLMLASVLAGCASEQVNNDTNPETKPDASANTDVNAKPAAEKAPEKSLKIVTTIFPEYDWVREVLGDQAENDELTMLLDNGVDLHSYQPTADDIVKTSDCDLFIYVGGESDGWVDDALKNAANKNMKVINLLEVLGDSVKAEEVVEGMQETEHDHDHDHSKEVSTFEDDEVQDRSLSDWAGDWQSAYPFALDGTLDDAFAAMAEEGEMTAEEYKTYYQNGRNARALYKRGRNRSYSDVDKLFVACLVEKRFYSARRELFYVGRKQTYADQKHPRTGKHFSEKQQNFLHISPV